jgi:hypothetical protein
MHILPFYNATPFCFLTKKMLSTPPKSPPTGTKAVNVDESVKREHVRGRGGSVSAGAPAAAAGGGWDDDDDDGAAAAPGAPGAAAPAAAATATPATAAAGGAGGAGAAPAPAAAAVAPPPPPPPPVGGGAAVPPPPPPFEAVIPVGGDDGLDDFGGCVLRLWAVGYDCVFRFCGV